MEINLSSREPVKLMFACDFPFSRFRILGSRARSGIAIEGWWEWRQLGHLVGLGASLVWGRPPDERTQ